MICLPSNFSVQYDLHQIHYLPPYEVASDLYLFKLDDSTIIDFSGNNKTDGRYEALTNISSIKELYDGRGLVLDMVY